MTRNQGLTFHRKPTFLQALMLAGSTAPRYHGTVAISADIRDDAGMEESPWQVVLRHVARQWPPERWIHTGVVVGCSGGGDSIALVRILDHWMRQHAGRGFLIIAHYDHGLRGRDSDRDGESVKALASRLGWLFETRSDTPSTQHETEAAARRTNQMNEPQQLPRDEQTLRGRRLKFLSEVAMQHGARYVAMGHTSDDRVETVLHHLMRGTGPNGLTGITPHRPLGSDLVLVRPLLGVSRQMLRDALVAIDQTWREDTSNQSNDYTRNWIRNEVLPLMRQRFPNVDAAVERATDSLRSWHTFIQQSAQEWVEGSTTFHPTDGAARRTKRVTIDLDDLPADAVLISGMSLIWDRAGWGRQAMTAEHWRRITDAIRNRNERSEFLTLPGEIRWRVDSTTADFQRTINGTE